MAEDERRRFSRVQWEGEATAEINGLRVHCRATDVSLGGMKMTSEWHAYAGRPIGVRFRVEGKPVYLRGVVAWSSREGERHAWGIRFTGAHASCIRRLYSFLRSHVDHPARTEKPANDDTAPMCLSSGVPLRAELAPTARDGLRIADPFPGADTGDGVPVAIAAVDDSLRRLNWATG